MAKATTTTTTKANPAPAPAPAPALPNPGAATVNNKATGLLSSQQVNSYKASLPNSPATATLTTNMLAFNLSRYPGASSHRAHMAQAFIAAINANPGCTVAQIVAIVAKKHPNGWGSVPCNAAQITGFLQPNGYVVYNW